MLENLKAVYKQLPADLARDVPAALEAGAGIIGSCCGSMPEHTRGNPPHGGPVQPNKVSLKTD